MATTTVNRSRSSTLSTLRAALSELRRRAPAAMAIAASLLAVTPLPAGADPQFKSGMSPAATGCQNGATTLSSKVMWQGKSPYRSKLGTEYLRYSARCGMAWVKVDFTADCRPGHGCYGADPLVWNGGHKDRAVRTARDSFLMRADGSKTTFSGMIEARGVSVCGGTTMFQDGGIVDYFFMVCTAPGRGTRPQHASPGPNPYGTPTGETTHLPGTPAPVTDDGGGDQDGGDQGSEPPQWSGPPAAVSASNNNGQMAVQVVNFPTGPTPFFCHAGGAPDYPTGGTITGRGQVTITSSNQSWSSGLCAGGHNTNMWIGFQGTDGHDYYSNQTVIDVAATPGAAVSIFNNNGQMAVQVVNFPTGPTPFFCHAGGAPDYPTGGTITGRGQVTITSSNQSWSSGLCAGGHNTNMWIGFQGTDGHDYYSNQTVIDVAATPGASASVFGSSGQMSLQLTSFPVGTNYYFCHQGDPSQYPTGGAIIGRGQLNVGSPSGTYGPLCSGVGNAWIGVQGADGHDYYSNEITL